MLSVISFKILVLPVLFNFHFYIAVNCISKIHGRYTRDIEDYELVVPFKATSNSEFSSYKIPHFYEHRDQSGTRKKRSRNDPEMIHYIINFGEGPYHAELWPNHRFISPNAISENYDSNIKVNERKIKNLVREKKCHYTGGIRDQDESRVAISTCDGLAGYIALGGKTYFIEPVESHSPNAKGQHLHVVYQKLPADITSNKCGTTNWKDAWKKRFQEKIVSDGIVEKRSSASVHRYLETLIVCDKKFVEHHKNADYENYVLTIMNMVADFYHDSSSGHRLDVIVVRVMYLAKEEEEIDLVINPDAEKTLASFCAWQQKINPEISSPNHHDIAVLLTRYIVRSTNGWSDLKNAPSVGESEYDICSNNLANCGLMGLAYVASACTGNEPCAINEDGGLVLGIVVAHEMGHVMGCAHDKEGESSCPAQDSDESFFVMAPYVHLYTTRWSTCSKGFMTSLFDNGLGDCLNDEPENSIYKHRDVLPGVVYDARQQCNFAFPGSTMCGFSEGNYCEILLCQTEPGKCVSKEEPPADGTKCGAGKWCYKKKCVGIGSRPQAVNGGWGKWGPFSKCSRTCGGGVEASVRECDDPVPSHGGSYCLGERQQLKTCNMDPCPPGTKSFRDAQCADHNDKPFQDRLHQWSGYFVSEEPCVLYCLSSERVYAKLEPRVKDGTKCKPGTHDMCISGVCKKVGCDGQFDSNVVEDICGVCNGDGTECKIVDKTYTGKLGQGYTRVAIIPAASRNVRIEEISPSTNTIAISDTADKFYLNGDNREERDGDKSLADTVGIYTHPAPQKELLIIHGPLTQELVLYVNFFVQENVGYNYKYSEVTTDASYVPSYHYEQVDWEDCSVKCGGGFQNAVLSCIEKKSGRVSNSFCDNEEKPPTPTQRCNEQACKTRWKIGSWGKCHACKFKSGVRIREVECVQEASHAGTDDILVEDILCAGPKPGSRELCNSHKKCKNRRYTDGMSDSLMERIWQQMRQHNDVLRKQPYLTNNEVFINKKSCDEEGNEVPETKDKAKEDAAAKDKEKAKAKDAIKLQVGKIVKDTIPEKEIKILEFPIKETNMELSDNAFETAGDTMGNTVDMSKMKISTGKEASKILKKLGHPKT